MPPVTALNYTGERMVPEAAANCTFWEHVYRYNFAARFATGRDVLDIACGEGYGSAALLEGGARTCVGVDIDPVSCTHARMKYGLDARVGSAEEIPLNDGAVDLVVSFETVEHVADPQRMVAECRRVLRADGTLIISTPDKRIYGVSGNPYHCSEMTPDEFLAILQPHFRHIELHCQRATRGCLRMPSSYFNYRKSLGFLTRFAGRALNPLLSPGYSFEPSSWARNNVQRMIARRTGRGAHLVNPFIVRPARLPCRDLPMYYIAVASN